jgi:hypothetical protein
MFDEDGENYSLMKTLKEAGPHEDDKRPAASSERPLKGTAALILERNCSF